MCDEYQILKDMFLVIVLSVLLLDHCSYLVVGLTLVDDNCPIWHIRRKNVCECGANVSGAVSCDKAQNILVRFGSCMTWDNISQSVTINSCPFLYHVSTALCLKNKFYDTIESSTSNISRSELNNITCEKYNRQSTQCRQ